VIFDVPVNGDIGLADRTELRDQVDRSVSVGSLKLDWLCEVDNDCRFVRDLEAILVVAGE
jgi:hypothetical protein